MKFWYPLTLTTNSIWNSRQLQTLETNWQSSFPIFVNWRKRQSMCVFQLFVWSVWLQPLIRTVLTAEPINSFLHSLLLLSSLQVISCPLEFCLPSRVFANYLHIKIQNLISHIISLYCSNRIPIVFRSVSNTNNSALFLFAHISHSWRREDWTLNSSKLSPTCRVD